MWTLVVVFMSQNARVRSHVPVLVCLTYLDVGTLSLLVEVPCLCSSAVYLEKLGRCLRKPLPKNPQTQATAMKKVHPQA